MWDKLTLVHGGDENVLRARGEKSERQNDDMRMKEDKNGVQHVN